VTSFFGRRFSRRALVAGPGAVLAVACAASVYPGGLPDDGETAAPSGAGGDAATTAGPKDSGGTGRPRTAEGQEPAPAPRLGHPGRVSTAACARHLRRARVDFAPYDGRGADAVEQPITLDGPVRSIPFRSGGRTAWSDALDCRLALALVAWSDTLREAGVTAVRHYSMLRPGARVRSSGKVSGHARGLAIDVAKLRFADDRVLEVETHWPTQHGAPPCDAPPEASGDDAATLTRLLCQPVAEGLFQMLISPNHDRAHHNHVHLELVPDWDEPIFVR